MRVYACMRMHACMHMRVYACMRGYVLMGAMSEHVLLYARMRSYENLHANIHDRVKRVQVTPVHAPTYPSMHTHEYAQTNTDLGLHTPTARKSTLTHVLPRAQLDTHRHKHRHTPFQQNPLTSLISRVL